MTPSSPDNAKEVTPFTDKIAEQPAADQGLILLRRQPFWQKIGGPGLVVSIVIHAILLILFGAWVISSWTDSAKTDPDTFATGSGGGAAGERAKAFEHKLQPKNVKNLAKTSARITSKSSSSTLALPDIPSTAANSLISGITEGGSSKGFGGGSGGGIGSGVGAGVGNAKNFVGIFGGGMRRNNAMEGTLYDLKFAPDGKALVSSRPQRIAEMKEAFGKLDGGWRGGKGMLDKSYRQAEKKLYTSNLFIHPLAADEATKAFDCEKEIQAPGWLAYYEGWFTPPETGEYRFQGFADDMMAVAVDGTTVLSAFWPGQGDGSAIPFRASWLPKDGHKTDGMQLRQPKEYGHLGARYKGSWLQLRKGQAYFIQIAISESHGGIFSSELLIEQKGEKYSKGTVEDIIPYFMLEPMPAEEIKLKLNWKMPKTWGYGASRPWHTDGATEGPSFGCEINKVSRRSAPR